MKISKERVQELRDKVDFVNNISGCFKYLGRYSTVEKIEYDVFDAGECVQEYVVVTFVGGAKSVANSQANSMSAIFRLIGKLIDGGYYDELHIYERKCEDRKPLEVE